MAHPFRSPSTSLLPWAESNGLVGAGSLGRTSGRRRGHARPGLSGVPAVSFFDRGLSVLLRAKTRDFSFRIVMICLLLYDAVAMGVKYLVILLLLLSEFVLSYCSVI